MNRVQYQSHVPGAARSRIGWYAWRLHRYQLNRLQPFRMIFDAAVRQVFSDAKQHATSLRSQELRAKAAWKFRPVNYRRHGLLASEDLLKKTFYASGHL